jgi:hypothetical protein
MAMIDAPFDVSPKKLNKKLATPGALVVADEIAEVDVCQYRGVLL